MTELTVSRELQRGQIIVPKTSRAPHKKKLKSVVFVRKCTVTHHKPPVYRPSFADFNQTLFKYCNAFNPSKCYLNARNASLPFEF